MEFYTVTAQFDEGRPIHTTVKAENAAEARAKFREGLPKELSSGNIIKSVHLAEHITTAQAAELLDITHRRVQQLAKAMEIETLWFSPDLCIVFQHDVLNFKRRKPGRPPRRAITDTPE